jgi:hypothetical protein
LQTLPTFAVGWRTTNMHLAPSPPFFCNICVLKLGQWFVLRQESASNSHVDLQ